MQIYLEISIGASSRVYIHHSCKQDVELEHAVTVSLFQLYGAWFKYKNYHILAAAI